MKICFYAPSDYSDPSINMSGPSQGIAYISSYLKQQHGIENISLELEAERVIAQKPDLVAMSVFTVSYGAAIEGAKTIKASLDAPIIIGGPHISALPTTLQSTMDIGVKGEGEIAMSQVVELLLKGKLEPKKLRKLSNLVFWNEEGKIEQSTQQERIQDLDGLPLPERSLLEAYWPATGEVLAWQQGLCTSRGCPFTCRFCMYSQTSNLVRYHSIDRVMEDIEDVLRNYPQQRHIRINDDLFVTRKDRLKELADRIREEKIHKKVSFGCMAKAHYFDREFAQLLKDMNVVSISFGFESGADRVLHYLKDRFSSVERNQQAIDICRRYGIHVGGFFIMGSPCETKAELAQTYWFIQKNLPVMPMVGVFPLQPMPGTSVWHEARSKGFVDDSFNNWDIFSYQALDRGTYMHLNEGYSNEEMLNAHHQQFVPLRVLASGHMVLLFVYRYLLQTYYQQLIEPVVKQHFQAGLKILEINRGDRPLSIEMEDHFQLTSLHWLELDQLPRQHFDGIVLTHTLEKIGLNSSFWKTLRSYQCPILLIIENANSLIRLFSLLKSNPIPYNPLEQYESRYHYDLNNLEPLLKQHALKISQTHKHQIPSVHSDFGQELMQYIKQANFAEGVDFSSYPILDHFLTQAKDHKELEQLMKLLPKSYLQEAKYFSYSLLLEPTTSQD